jgi:hypothetical protein
MITVRGRLSPRVRREFHRLCELEPRLRQLHEQIRAVRDDPVQPSFCANAAWYGFGAWRERGFKREMSSLVGLERYEEDPSAPEELKTREAYDVAYSVLYRLLPDCRNCDCEDRNALPAIFRRGR